MMHEWFYKLIAAGLFYALFVGYPMYLILVTKPREDVNGTN